MGSSILIEPPPTRLSDVGSLERALDTANGTALACVTDHFALVKTVKDGDWLRLLHNLSSSRDGRFRTSLTLLPPSGRMHLFGSASSQGAGLLFDRRGLDLSGALCWPSGYFAKTEHHLAIRYNEQSILEMHSCAASYQIINTDATDPFAGFPSKL